MWALTSVRSSARAKRSGSMPIGKAATRVSDPLSSTPSGVPCALASATAVKPGRARGCLVAHHVRPA